jgi:hypothetical protein
VDDRADGADRGTPASDGRAAVNLIRFEAPFFELIVLVFAFWQLWSINRVIDKRKSEKIDKQD